MKNKDHLPVYGVGPIIVNVQIVFTIVGIVLSALGFFDMGKIPVLKVPFLIIGIILILFGLYLWYCANYKAKVFDHITENTLVTTGVYAIVRNPIYSAFFLFCTGAVFIANNLILFIVPVICWLYMTVMLINTEEKWLSGLYGEEYTEYCKKVNRCIPWFPNMKPRKNRKKMILTIFICIVVVIFLVAMPIMTVMIYHDNFGNRYETAEWMAYSVDEFEGLQVEECTFTSNNGQLLAGYKYSKEGQQVKGVVVIAHGLGGGGHNTYMDVADYFASNGYLVFAYDATGNDKSEGDSVEGLPQGVIDLDYALRYVKQADEYKDLPIVLFGHSWGGYSVGNVLNCHPDVKAAVLVAGFNRSTDLMEQQGESMIGFGIKLFMPYFSLYERLKFGEYAAYSAINGFADSNAGIMVIHSKDDEMVFMENGYDKFYDIYGDDARFRFIQYEDRGHNYIYYSEAASQYRDQLNEDYIAYVEANGGEYNAEIKTEFIEKYLDKSKCYEFDDDLMQQILEFYDFYCK